MRRALTIVVMVLGGAAVDAADPPDPLTEARELYNKHEYVAAINAAERARLTPASVDRADLIAARAYLERYRSSNASDDLTNARDRLRRIGPREFDSRERTEYIVGLG